MKKPNILFLMCDQLQGRVFQSEHPCKTPNLDKLFSRGVRFERAYTPNPVCSPARASLMTGLLPHNNGVLWVTHTVDQDQGCLRMDKPHWAQKLVETGYSTGYFGKWHIERSNELERFGWQTNCENNSSLYKAKAEKLLQGDMKKEKISLFRVHDDNPGYKTQHLHYGVTNIKPEKRGMGLTTSMALEFMEGKMGEKDPWCCFVSVQEPHDPFVCGEDAFKLYDMDALELPENFKDTLENRPGIYRKAARVWRNMTDAQKKEAMACYYSSITEIDQQFGRILAKLEEGNQFENTIIILTADHGELLGAHGLYCKNISAAEEVYNIPLFMAGPGIASGVVTSARVGLHDLCPTLLELVGCEPFVINDSSSFVSVLKSPEEEGKYTKGFAEYHGGRMLLTQRVVWDGPWKFIFNGFDFDELYNLEEDPFEMKNLIHSSTYDEIVRKMCVQMWKVIRDTNDHSINESHYPILRVAPYGPETL